MNWGKWKKLPLKSQLPSHKQESGLPGVEGMLGRLNRNPRRIEAPEDDPLLEEAEIESMSRQTPHRRQPAWLLNGILILLCLILGMDNIRLRKLQSFATGFDTDMRMFNTTSR
jgi:hypothetical protein